MFKRVGTNYYEKKGKREKESTKEIKFRGISKLQLQNHQYHRKYLDEINPTTPKNITNGD
jgi:hypothetical protein